MPTPGWRRSKYADGLTAIDQGQIGKYHISYNPDDAKFYVYDIEKEETVGVFRELRNATNFARKKAGPGAVYIPSTEDKS